MSVFDLQEMCQTCKLYGVLFQGVISGSHQTIPAMIRQTLDIRQNTCQSPAFPRE